MGFLLHSKLLAGPATLMRVPDTDSDSPRVYSSRWKKKKKEGNIIQPSKGGNEGPDDIRFPASVDKSSKNRRRLRPTVKQLPQSILTLVRFVIKKTFPSRGKGRSPQKRKGKHRNPPTTKVEILKKDAASSALLPEAAAAPRAAAFTAATEERRVHEILYWKTSFSLIKVVQLLAVPVTMHQAFQEVETRVRSRGAAGTTNAFSCDVNNSTNTRRCYRSTSRLWQSGMCHVLKPRRTRFCIKDVKPKVVDKPRFLLIRSPAVSLLSRSICKRFFGLPGRERRAMKDRLSCLQLRRNGRRKHPGKVRSHGENRRDNGVDEESTPIPVEDLFAVRCRYQVVQAWEDKRGSVDRARRASLSLAARSSSALAGETCPLSRVKGGWKMTYSALCPGEYLMNERSNMQGEKNIPHPYSVQNLSPVPLVSCGQARSEYHAQAAGDKVPILLARAKNTYFVSTLVQRQRGLQKQESLQICDIWEKNKPCTQQGTRLWSDARNKADVLSVGYSRLPEHVQVKPDRLSTNSVVVKVASTKEGAELPRVNSLCAGRKDCPSHRPLQPPAPLQGNSLMRGGDVSSSSLYFVEQNGSHRKPFELATRRCGSYQFHSQTASNAGLKQEIGYLEEFVALVKTASPTSRALVHPPRSPRSCMNEPSLLCPRPCLLWGCYYPPRGSAHLPYLPYHLSEKTQQAAVHPRRSILVEKNNILLEGAEGGEESTCKRQCQRKRARNAFWMWNCLPKKKSKKRRVRLRFEAVECIAYYSVYQPPAASAFYRCTRLSTQTYFGDKALRPPLQPRKKGVRELKSGMTAEEAIQWSLSTKNARNKFAQCSAV